jgi:hypothetical protein
MVHPAFGWARLDTYGHRRRAIYASDVFRFRTQQIQNSLHIQRGSTQFVGKLFR